MPDLKYTQGLLAAMKPAAPRYVGAPPRLTIAAMRAALPEAADFSDRDLVELWSQANGRDFGELADEVGLPRTGLLREMGGQALAGVTVDIPEMTGKALQYFSEPGRPAYEAGEQLRSGAERRGLTALPDVRDRNIVSESLVMGSRALAPSVATVGATLAGGFAGGVIGATAAGGAVATGLFGGSAAQDTYERLIEETGDEQAARSAAMRVLALQGVGETGASLAGAWLLKPFVRTLSGAKTMKDVANRFTNPRIYRDFARNMALVQYPTQISTEVAQDVGTSLIEQAYGASPEDLSDIAVSSAKGAFGLTTILGGFGLGSASVRQRNAERLKLAIEGDPNISPEEQAAARAQVEAFAIAEGIAPERAARWAQTQLRTAENRRTNVLANMEQRASEVIAAQQAYDTIDPNDEASVAAYETEQLATDEFVKLADELSGVRVYDKSGNERELTNGELLAWNSGVKIDWMPEQRQRADYDTMQEVEVDLTQTEIKYEDSRQLLNSIVSMERKLDEIKAAQEQQPLPMPDLQGVVQAEPEVDMVSQEVVAPVEQETPTVEAASVEAPTAQALPTGIAPLQEAPYLEGLRARRAPPEPQPVTQAQQPARDVEKYLDDNDAAVDQELIEAALASTSQPLRSEVAEGSAPMQAGRPTFSTPVFAAIRNAVLNENAPVRVYKRNSAEVDQAETAKYRASITRVAKATRDVASAYNAVVDTAGNMLRGSTVGKAASATAQEKVGAQYEKVNAAAEEFKGRFAILQEAVREMGGSDKDIDGIVRVVKDRVQARRQGTQDTRTARRYEQIDIGLSRGFEAVRRGALSDPAFDFLDVRGGESRLSREDQERLGAGQPTAVQQNVEQGRVLYGRKASETNLPRTGARGFIADLLEGGTPYEKTLAKALDRTFESMGDNAPRIAFKDGAKGEYDPATNTITVDPTASPEVRLHEALHGGLRYYVYNNQNAPEVESLMAAVKRVVAYTGPLDDKSTQVQMLLSNLVRDKGRAGELDAVLELVSYTNTSNFFRKTLQRMESDADTVPKDFLSSVKEVWNWLREVVNKFLGNDKNLANDVIRNTFSLMQKAAATDYRNATMTVLGNKLEMAVQSDAAVRKETDLSTVDYRAFTENVVPSRISTQVFFDLMNWPAVAAGFRKKSGELAERIRKDFPTVERYMTYINAFFSTPEAAARLLRGFKHTKNVPYQFTEMLIDKLENRPVAQQLALVDYMDGDTKAFDRFANSSDLKALAGKVKTLMEQMISELPPAQQKVFVGKKFSEYLLFAKKSSNVAPHTYKAVDISGMVGQKTFPEPVLNLDWMNTDTNGDPILTDSFYEVFGPDLITSGSKPVHQNFMSVSKYERNGPPMGMTVDTSRIWSLQKKDKGGYKFISTLNTREVIAQGKGDDFFNALRNTMAAIATTNASKNMMTGLYNLGRSNVTDKNKDPDANAIAFDNVTQIRRVLGIDVDIDSVLLVSEKEAESPRIQSQYRSSNTWVQLPDNKAYGDMAGKIIRGPVWVSMIDMSDRTPWLNYRWYQKSLRFFKNTKTVYNPGTHTTNTFSNFLLAYMHDLTFKQLRAAARVYALFHTKPDKLSAADTQMMMDFIESGAMLGDISTSEIKESIFDSMLKTDDSKSEGTVLQQMQTFVRYEQIKSKLTKLGDTAINIYSAEDNIFRLAAFIKKTGELQQQRKEATPSRGTVTDAGTFARQAFVDYDVDSKAVRMLRSSILPFVTFTYGILPVLGRIALNTPWKIANVITALYLVGAATASMVDDDDEETRKMLPKQVRDRMFLVGPYIYLRMPFSDSENPAYLRVGDYFPLAGAAAGMPNGFLGQSWWPQGLSPSNPFINVILAAFGGVDAYTGRPIHEGTDESLDKLWNITKSAYNTFAPPTISTANMDRAAGVVTGATGPTGAPYDAAVFARALAGIRLYNYNLEEAEFFKGIEIRNIQRDYQTAMAKAKREEAQSGSPDYEALDAELVKLVERMQAEINKALGEE